MSSPTCAPPLLANGLTALRCSSLPRLAVKLLSLPFSDLGEASCRVCSVGALLQRPAITLLRGDADWRRDEVDGCLVAAPGTVPDLASDDEERRVVEDIVAEDMLLGDILAEGEEGLEEEGDDKEEGDDENDDIVDGMDEVEEGRWGEEEDMDEEAIAISSSSTDQKALESPQIRLGLLQHKV